MVAQGLNVCISNIHGCVPRVVFPRGGSLRALRVWSVLAWSRDGVSGANPEVDRE